MTLTLILVALKLSGLVPLPWLLVLLPAALVLFTDFMDAWYHYR